MAYISLRDWILQCERCINNLMNIFIKFRKVRGPDFFHLQAKDITVRLLNDGLEFFIIGCDSSSAD